MGKTLPFLALKLLLEVQGIQLLLHESGDAALDLLQVLMIAIIDLANVGEDALLLLRAAELREPLGLSSFQFLLFAEMTLGVVLELLEILLSERAEVLSFGSLGGLGSVDEGLDRVAREASLGGGLEKTIEEGLLG